MKRNWDVIREVLLVIEALDPKKFEGHHYDVAEDDEQRTAAHAVLLWKAGFVEGRSAGSDDGPYVIASGLTWQGHDLLQTIQSKPVWEKIKTTAQEKGVELTFEVVKRLGSMALDSILGK